MTKSEKKSPENQEVNPEVAQPQVEQTEDLQTKLNETKDALIRAMAELENTRKRAMKEIEDANKYGTSTIAKDLIPVLENLQLALDNIAPKDLETAAVKHLFEGVDLTRKELLSVFERRGIRRIEPKPGERFDHNFHQAIAQVEDPKFEPGAVIQVIQAGYVIHDRLLRPAMVTVSKGAQQQKPNIDRTA